MHKFSRVLAAVAAIAAAGGGAHAADLDPILTPQAPEYVPVEIGNGWYLRGDISYSFAGEGDGASYRVFDGSNYSNLNFDSADYGTNWGVGGAVGYQFNEWVRGEFGLDYFRGDFSGATRSDAPCDGTTTGTSCRSEENSDFYSVGAMANVYADLGTYAGFTPYVGAGLGATYVNYDTLTSTNFCVPGTAMCDGVATSQTTHEGEADWRFTYDLMAGVGYKLSKNMTLDVGYRFRKVNDGAIFAFDQGSQNAGASGAQGFDGGYTQHDVKVGLRYSLW